MSMKRKNSNEINRSEWLKAQLLALPPGAGTGVRPLTSCASISGTGYHPQT